MCVLEGALQRAHLPRAARAFSDETQRSIFLLAIASQVAQSIEHAKLYEEACQRRVQELEALARILEAVSGIALPGGVARGDREDDDADAPRPRGRRSCWRTARSAWPEGRADAHAIRQPLRWRGRSIGELVADRASPFTQYDRELLACSIAQQAAVALEHLGRARGDARRARP